MALGWSQKGLVARPSCHAGFSQVVHRVLLQDTYRSQREIVGTQEASMETWAPVGLTDSGTLPAGWFSQTMTWRRAHKPVRQDGILRSRRYEVTASPPAVNARAHKATECYNSFGHPDAASVSVGLSPPAGRPRRQSHEALRRPILDAPGATPLCELISPAAAEGVPG